VAIAALNWIGDTLMSWPALQAFHAARSAAAPPPLILVKPALAALWDLYPRSVTRHLLRPGFGGVLAAARALRRARPATVYCLPHSFRSALPAWLARAPRRRGLAGGGREFLLTEVARPADGDPARRHQAFEYFALFGLTAPSTPPAPPALCVPEAARAAVAARWAARPRPWTVLLPGAARGPAKRWPEANFAALGKQVAETTGGTVLLSGGPAERALCARLAATIGPAAANAADTASVAEWAALLAAADAVVANDSGGMHLAAALDRPVVALYGRTDPAVTGPLGRRVTILQHSERRARDIAPDDPAARAALAAITPEEARAAVCAWLG